MSKPKKPVPALPKGNHGWDVIVEAAYKRQAVEDAKAREAKEREARERHEARLRKFGWLPPVSDKNLVASEEIAKLKADLNFAADMIEARVGALAPEGDAFWDSDWSLYPTREMMMQVIGSAFRLGGLLSNSQTRRQLETSLAKSALAAHSIEKRQENAKNWQGRVEEESARLLQERERPMTQIAPLVHKAIRPPVDVSTVLDHLRAWNRVRKKK